MRLTPSKKVFTERTLVEVFSRKTGQRLSMRVHEPGDLVRVYDRRCYAIRSKILDPSTPEPTPTPPAEPVIKFVIRTSSDTWQTVTADLTKASQRLSIEEPAIDTAVVCVENAPDSITVTVGEVSVNPLSEGSTDYAISLSKDTQTVVSLGSDTYTFTFTYPE